MNTQLEIFNVHKFLLLSLLTLYCSAFTLAQSPGKCNLPVEKAPVLWGLKLGAAYEEIKKRYPYMEEGAKDDAGEMRTSILPKSGPGTTDADRALSGLRVVLLSFVDNRLAVVIAQAGSTTYISDLNNYARNFSAANNLPGEWTPDNSGRGVQLECVGFSLGINSITSVAERFKH